MATGTPKPGIFARLSLVLGLLLVVIGLLHTMPSFPGLDDWVKNQFGDGAAIRRFPY